MAQAIVAPALLKAHRATIVGNPGLVIEGRVESKDGSVSARGALLAARPSGSPPPATISAEPAGQPPIRPASGPADNLHAPLLSPARHRLGFGLRLPCAPIPDSLSPSPFSPPAPLPPPRRPTSPSSRPARSTRESPPRPIQRRPTSSTCRRPSLRTSAGRFCSSSTPAPAARSRPRSFGPRPSSSAYDASSNNTMSDGPWEPNTRAVNAMFPDLMKRLPIDDRRVYATGFSGGAMLSWIVGLRTGQLAGVLSVGGRLPDGLEDQVPGFAFWAAAGRTDFNYRPSAELDAIAAKAGVPHRLEYFDGPQTPTPAADARRALGWFEVLAMRDGRRPRDEAFVDAELAVDVRRRGARAAGSRARSAPSFRSDRRELRRTAQRRRARAARQGPCRGRCRPRRPQGGEGGGASRRS